MADCQIFLTSYPLASRQNHGKKGLHENRFIYHRRYLVIVARCEACGVFVKDENLWKHYKKVHPKTPLPVIEQKSIREPKRIKQPRQPMSHAGKAVGIVILVLVVAIGAGLYYFPPQRTDLGDCILSIAYHWHTTLLVYEDDNLVTIPADIGTEGCLHTMHTHSSNNVIHIEPPSADIRYTVGDFFELWGRPYGAPQEVSVDGQLVETGADTVFQDAITIEIRY